MGDSPVLGRGVRGASVQSSMTSDIRIRRRGISSARSTRNDPIKEPTRTCSVPVALSSRRSLLSSVFKLDQYRSSTSDALNLQYAILGILHVQSQS